MSPSPTATALNAVRRSSRFRKDITEDAFNTNKPPAYHAAFSEPAKIPAPRGKEAGGGDRPAPHAGPPPQQWVRVRRLARKKIENDINQRLWKQFLNNINPRKPAPGPDYGIIAKHPANLGNRLWWQQLKCAHHGGSKRFTSLRWMPGEWREDGPGNPV